MPWQNIPAILARIPAFWLLAAILTGAALAEPRFEVVRSFGFPEKMSGAPLVKLLAASDGLLYGVTRAGGLNGGGTLYRFDPASNDFRVLKAFDPAAGVSTPASALIEGSDGLLYGTTDAPGSVFSFNRASGAVETVKLTGLDSTYMSIAGVTEARDGYLYGAAMSEQTGAAAFYRVAKNGEDFKIIRTVTRAADQAAGFRHRLLEGRDGLLYATSVSGGNHDRGALARLAKDGSGFQIIHHFGETPDSPRVPTGGVIQSQDGLLYGALANWPGDVALGVIYRINTDGSGLTVIHHFGETGIQSPQGELVEGPDGTLYGNTASLPKDTGRIFAMNRDGTGYRVLGTAPGPIQFSYYAVPGIAMASNGQLYGVDYEDGSNARLGVIYSQNPSGAGETTRWVFTSTGGDGTPEWLVEGMDKWFYGTTSVTGDGSSRLFYKVRRDGTGRKVLRNFPGGWGANEAPLIKAPTAPLVAADDGYLYSVSESAGVHGAGAVIRLSTEDGSHRFLTEFDIPDNTKGPSQPSGLMLGSDGLLYGMSVYGGNSNDGTIFRIARDGTGLRVVHHFTGILPARVFSMPREARDGRLYGRWYQGIYTLNRDGSNFQAFQIFTATTSVSQSGSGGLIEGSDGWFYGFQTTSGRINEDGGLIYKVRPDGTGAVKLLGFKAPLEPSAPAGLLESSDGYLYGLTRQSIFRMHPDGSGYETLKLLEFSSSNQPQPGNFLLSPDGNFYGTAKSGGDSNLGVIFRYGESPEITVESPVGTAWESGTAVLDFGVRVSGDPVETRKILLKNTGSKTLALGDFSLNGAGTGDFSISGPPAGSVAPGESLEVTVGFHARLSATRTVTLRLPSDDYDEPVFDITLKAVATAPLLAVNQDSATGPPVTNGQSAAAAFGETPVKAPLTRGFALANTGDGPLRLASVSVPAGFTAEFPQEELAPGSTGFLKLTLTVEKGGTFAGPVVLRSNDPLNGEFTFPVTATVLAPEIEVRDGGNPDSPELTSGQAAAVDFGRNIQGTPSTRSLTVHNTGNAPLTLLSLTMPTGFAPEPVFTGPATVPAGGTLTIKGVLSTLERGTHSGIVTLLNDDEDEGAFTFPVTGEIHIPDPVAMAPSATTTLDRQTGLRRQTVRLVNDTTATVPAYRLLIRGLPEGVRISNAASVLPDGTVVVVISRPLAPHSSFDAVLEYASANRFSGGIAPEIRVEAVFGETEPEAPDAGAASAIERLIPLEDGSMLLEFSSSPGAVYEVLYSGDGLTWKTSAARVESGGSRCQWIDRGPPRTDAPPSQTPKRFYRVRRVAP